MSKPKKVKISKDNFLEMLKYHNIDEINKTILERGKPAKLRQAVEVISQEEAELEL